MPLAERLTAMRRFTLLVAVMGVIASCGGSEGPAAAEPLPSADELIEQFGVTPAELQDIEFVAAEEGWTLAEAINRLGWQEGFSTFVGELRSEYPDDFASAGILFEEGPRDAYIAFSGPVPDDVRNDPRLSHLDVEFRESLGFSEAELVDQVIDVHYTMRDLGFFEIDSGPDIDTGQVRVETARRPIDRGKTDEEIIATLPSNVRTDNVVIVFHPEGTVLNAELE